MILPRWWGGFDQIHLAAAPGFGDQLAIDVADPHFDSGLDLEPGVLVAFAQGAGNGLRPHSLTPVVHHRAHRLAGSELVDMEPDHNPDARRGVRQRE